MYQLRCTKCDGEGRVWTKKIHGPSITAAANGPSFNDDPRLPLDERVDAYEAWLCRDALAEHQKLTRRAVP